jgi:hypothetical protein
LGSKAATSLLSVVEVVVVVELTMTMLPIGYAIGGVTWGYLCGKRDGGVFGSIGYVLHCLIASGIHKSTAATGEPGPREGRED